jgi:MFS transporter, FSR family, fosmidomycin resistance protein
VQIGLLLSVPGIIASLIEPVLGILADVWKRRVLILGGGVCFALGCLMTALSGSFYLLMFSTILLYPASGAFVSLSQAALMDTDPTRHDYNMARWTLAGSVGVVVGPLALGVALWLGAGWRTLYFVFAGLALLLTLIASRFPFRNGHDEDDEAPQSFADGMRGAWQALRRGEVLRWLLLLAFSNLMLDVLYSYLALYFVDAGGVTPAQAGIAVAVWTGCGLIGDLLLIPLLERFDGLSYLRVSAVLEGLLFPAFLLVPGFVPKLVILAVMGFFNAGWYAILQGRLYSAMPGQSGTVTTVSNVTGLFFSLIPLVLGVVAENRGIDSAMWLMMAGPIALLIGLPRKK